MFLARRIVAGALTGALVVALAPPASAATASYADPAGDVMSFSEEGPTTTADARADILGVTVQNDADVVQITVQMAEAVPLSDADWRGDLSLTVTLSPPNDDFSGGTMFVGSGPDGPVPFQVGLCDLGFTADTATDRYVLRVDDECVRAYPRVATPFVLLGHGDLLDIAPGDLDDDEPVAPVTSASTVDVRRIAGTDRTLTAIELSRDRFGDDDADAVVLASSAAFPDALAGGPLATYAGAPLLLTGAASLDGRTAAELARVLPAGGTVYVLGGTAALSDEVLADVRAAGFVAERVAGVNRFAPAVAIAEKGEAVVRERFASLFAADDVEPAEADVFLADGRTFTDALIAGAAAAKSGGFLLLTDGSVMAKETRAYLDEHDPGTIAIGSAATAAWPGADMSIVGGSPGQLSRRVLDDLGLLGGTVAVASEDTFADALAGGGHIGGIGPLLLTDGATLDQHVQTALEGAVDSLREVVIYGGTAAISTAVERAIEGAVATS